MLLVILIVSIKANYSLYTRNDKARENKDTLQSELDALKERKDALVAMLGKIDTDKGQEIALRRRFDMGREGEELIVIVESDEASEASKVRTSSIFETLKEYIPFFR
ncbi:MAG: hypothetical protein RI911_130 [Candidatus Parcubacteria bacterium]